jgi:hypothetical protein
LLENNHIITSLIDEEIARNADFAICNTDIMLPSESSFNAHLAEDSVNFPPLTPLVGTQLTEFPRKNLGGVWTSITSKKNKRKNKRANDRSHMEH